MKIRLSPQGKNMTELEFGGVATLYFSYESCIAIRSGNLDRGGLFNPDMRGRSVTTTKHATQMAVKGLPDAESPEAFAAAVAAAVAFAAKPGV